MKFPTLISIYLKTIHKFNPFISLFAVVRRKTIYEYHRVNFNRQDIMNCTVIYLKALPTCLDIDNCRDCLTKVPDFDCKWCSELNQCSTGTFRSRQDWLLKGCDVRNIKKESNCPAQIATYKGEEYDHDGHVHPEESITANEMSAKQERPNISSLESCESFVYDLHFVFETNFRLALTVLQHSNHNNGSLDKIYGSLDDSLLFIFQLATI